jgi:Holliday junction resolvasome RuvABC endonuclease subunit
MIILGADLSPTSSGFVKFILNESFEIIEIKKLGFYAYEVPKKKAFTVPSFKDIVSYDKNKYDFYNRTLMMTEHILEFIKDVDYAIIEDYSFGSTSSGYFTEIAEFCSQVKFQLLKNGTKIRLISPLQNKQFATGDGRAEKPDMYDAFESQTDKKIDISDLPKIPVHIRGKFVGLRNKDGQSPLSDLVDGYWLCYLLYNELLLRNGIKTLVDLDPKYSHVLSHTTKKNKLPLTKQPFLEYVK